MRRPRDSAALIIAGRVVLLLVASAALVAAVALQWRGHSGPHDGRVQYACPMHPQITTGSPGTCPICGMALDRLVRPAPDAAASLATETGSADVLSLPVPIDKSTLRGPLITVKNLDVTTALHVSAFLDDANRVVALMSNDEVASLVPGEHGAFVTSLGVPPLGVRLAADPPARRDASTALVTFHLETPRPEPRPGIVGWVDLPPRPRRLLLVPNEAVIDSPTGPYILVASSDRRTFTKRRVEIGGSHSTYTVLLSGAEAGEHVVVTDLFFVDAERRLRAGLLPAQAESGP